MHENTNRCNGHIQVSPIGKTAKRDRKGCKKGKIEMIMKNNMGATKPKPVQLDSVFKKKTKLFSSSNHHQQQQLHHNHHQHHHHHHLINSGSVIKNEIIDDPYTFTDSEPQTVGTYSAPNCLSLTRKVLSVATTTTTTPGGGGGVGGVAANQLKAGGGDLPFPSPLPPSVGGGKTVRTIPITPPHPPPPPTPTTCSVDHSTTNMLSSSSLSSAVTTTTATTMTMMTTPTTGSSKTMNQLQADIARNRVIVKRRKVVQHHQPSSASSSASLSHSHSHSSHSNSAHSESSPASRTFARVSIPAKRIPRQTTWQRERRTRHEALQRIQEAQQQVSEEKRDLFPLGLELSESENDEDDDEANEVYQRHWFMGWTRGGSWGDGGARGRESRLTQLRSELRRRLRQVWHGIERRGEPPPALVQAVVAAARTQPAATALLLEPRLLASYSKQSRAKVSMLSVKQCSLCERRALPCTRHCSDHIMYNVDQQLFDYCSAKLSDNTTCRVPVFDVIHRAALCPQHARSQVISTKIQSDNTPKRSRKKTKPSTLNRSRSKKKKKPRPVSSSSSIATTIAMTSATSTTTTLAKMEPPAAVDLGLSISVEATTVPTTITTAANSEMTNVFQADVQTDVSQVEIEVQLDGVEEVPEEVLAIASMDPAELASQASRLLEDHEFTNMLNMPPDAFNDLFTEDKNGEYEPTREETEELERALEAVDKDVRSLERTLTRSSGMTLPLPTLPLPLPLETMTLLDEVPNVYTYSNGFTSVQTDLRNS